jgi:hypothetical protein
MAAPDPSEDVLQSRRTFLRRLAVTAVLGVPVVGALITSPKAQGSTDWVSCVDSCNWTYIGGGPCGCSCDARCASPCFGDKYGCFDPFSGELCFCACGPNFGKPCCGTACTR